MWLARKIGWIVVWTKLSSCFVLFFSSSLIFFFFIACYNWYFVFLLPCFTCLLDYLSFVYFFLLCLFISCLSYFFSYFFVIFGFGFLQFFSLFLSLKDNWWWCSQCGTKLMIHISLKLYVFPHKFPQPPPHPLTNMLYLSLHSLVTQKQPPRHILAPGKLASFAILSHVSSFSTPIVDTLYQGRGGGCRKPVINYHYFTASNLSTNHAHVPVFFLLLTWLPATGAIFHPPVDYSFCGPSLGGRGDPPFV